MATTIVYLVTCPSCREATELDLDELFDDPLCPKCGENMGAVKRIEGFERQA
jgi:predicted RNA-binding Zn-ribbon protein involved in translation (DUF1610 family)